jgi:hypothetical protein
LHTWFGCMSGAYILVHLVNPWLHLENTHRPGPPGLNWLGNWESCKGGVTCKNFRTKGNFSVRCTYKI